MSEQSETQRAYRNGAMLMVASGLAFTVMVTLVKLARVEMDAISIMFWRGLVAVPVSFALAFRGWRGVPKAAIGPLALRCVLGFVAMFGFYYASSGVGIGELSFLSKLQPILLAILAPLLLGREERVSPRLWLVLGVSFAGVAVMLSPDLVGDTSWVELASSYGVVALGASAASSLAHLCVRRLGSLLNPGSTVVVFQIFVFLAAGLCVWSLGGAMAVPRHLSLPIVGIGLTSTLGQFLLTRAYSMAPAARIAALSYVSPIWGVLVDTVVFATLPGLSVWAGGALILVGAFLLTRVPAPSANVSPISVARI